jgi:hypothetical protein
MLCSGRGNDRTNLVAMAAGIIAVLFLGKVHLPGIVDFGQWMPDWWPEIAWPWYVLIGSLTTLAVAIPFRTPSLATEGNRQALSDSLK